MRRIGLALAWLSVAAAVIAFFLPWASLDLREPALAKQLRNALPAQGMAKGLLKRIGKVSITIQRGAETVTGELPDLAEIPKQVTGVEIPRLAHQPNAKVAIALLELLTNEHQRLDVNSYGVYLLPGLALLCGVILTALSRVRASLVAVTLFCAGLAGFGFWKLLTTKTDALFVAITIGPGLWLSLWAYVGLALAAILALRSRRRPN